ncbi:KxYKxGKxW signal peptide domain-containing protein [Leuconostoc citreum]|uniref:KxYKxGKxW signal peptide domain-containing protein n=1 Tax=Leuconostoc citreum TaxID=33964 RepID=UPI00200A43C1|nr:KxYKxGKxW signal peptide domain-containing protein [Leuconostoc citreum]MCK8605662.1 KxYKxGKxW signal peptide domain-containing protein [Leuconostoc citreum]
MNKRYKLYKDGKRLVIGTISVVGLTSFFGGLQVDASTTDQSSAVANVQLQKPDTKEQPNAQADEAPQINVNSDIATSVPANTTQTAGKSMIDDATKTVQQSGEVAKKAGIDVTQTPDEQVVLKQDNVTSETRKALASLNQQEQALKQATIIQQANQHAKAVADSQHDKASAQVESENKAADDNLDKQIASAKQAGLSVNVEIANSSPDYTSLKGLEGQALLSAMASNIEKFRQASSDGITATNADVKKLATMTAEYNQKKADFESATADRNQAIQKGKDDLTKARGALDKQTEIAKQAGISVNVEIANSSPAYTSLEGLEGQALLSAMVNNIETYSKAVSNGVQGMNADTAKLAAMTAEYNQKKADFATATTNRHQAIQKGNDELAQARGALDKQTEIAKQAGISVNVEIANSSPAYTSLEGLEGQALLSAMVNNIETYSKAVSNGVQGMNADTAKLAAMTAEYNQKKVDFTTATANRAQAIQTDSQNLSQAHDALDKQIALSKVAGLEVSLAVSQSTPDYKAIAGLTGQALLDNMTYNIDLYHKAIVNSVSTTRANIAKLASLTDEYKKAAAAYEGEKDKIDKANASKKQAYDKLVLARDNAIKAAVAEGDQHYQGTYDLNAYYGGYLNGKINYDYTYHWDVNKNNFVITNVSFHYSPEGAYHKGAGFWDTVYIQGPKYAIPNDSAKGNIQRGADLKENGNTLWDEVKSSQYGVMFYLSQNNRTGEVVVHQDNRAGVPFEATRLSNGDYELARFISRNRQGDSSVHNSEYANWIIGNKVVAHSSIPENPNVPKYEITPLYPNAPKLYIAKTIITDSPLADAPSPEKTTVTKHTPFLLPTSESPVIPKATVTMQSVDELPVATAPKKVQVSVTKHHVSVLPSAETPKNQKATMHNLVVQTVPTPTNEPIFVPVQQPTTQSVSVLPQTATSTQRYEAQQIAMAGLAVTLVGLGAVVAKRKYQNSHVI